MVSADMSSARPHTPHRSVMSPDITRSTIDRQDSVLPHESASHVGDDTHSEYLAEHSIANMDETPFSFKFKAPSGRVHRLQVAPASGIAELVSIVTAKLGSEVEAVGGEATVEDGHLGKTGYALSYLDNEGDTVSITTDLDLKEAITLSRQIGHDKVDLFVHDPEKPPISATLDPHPAPAIPATPPTTVSRSKAQSEADEEDEEEDEAPRRRRGKQAYVNQPEEQLIAGVPNELLLPGAIVTLAVVIVGVFALSRTGGRR